jgi:hypothetical protein
MTKHKVVQKKAQAIPAKKNTNKITDKKLPNDFVLFSDWDTVVTRGSANFSIHKKSFRINRAATSKYKLEEKPYVSISYSRLHKAFAIKFVVKATDKSHKKFSKSKNGIIICVAALFNHYYIDTARYLTTYAISDENFVNNTLTIFLKEKEEENGS